MRLRRLSSFRVLLPASSSFSAAVAATVPKPMLDQPSKLVELRTSHKRRAQPPPEFAVVGEQHAVSHAVHDPCRARDVADPAGTLEAVRMGVDEGFEPRDGLRFFRPPPAVLRQACLELVSVHALTPDWLVVGGRYRHCHEPLEDGHVDAHALVTSSQSRHRLR